MTDHDYRHDPDLLLGTIRDLQRRLEATESARANTEIARVDAEARLAALQGTRTFRYTAWARRLASKLSRMRSASAPAVLQGALDEPRDDQEADPDGVIAVSGWVVSGPDPVARVEIQVDGVVTANARLGIRRPEVGEALTEAEAHIGGFEAIVELDQRPRPRQAELRVAAVTFGDRRQELGAARITIPPADDESPSREPAAPRRSSPRTAGAALRLLVFTHDLNLGGAQLILLDLLRDLARDGVTGTVVAPRDGALRDSIEAAGFDLVVHGSHPMEDLPEYEGRQALLGEWARRGGFDAVLANTLLEFPGVDLASRLGLPAVWMVHESVTLRTFWREFFDADRPVDHAVRAHAGQALRSASAVVFEADSTRRLLVQHGDPGRFLTIPYGIDLPLIDEFAAGVDPADARRRLELEPDATILRCLGTIQRRKAQSLLARAFETLAPQHPNARLVFVGGTPDEDTVALENYLRDSGLDRQVTIKPVSPDVFDWHRAADALVIASDVESLPRTALEAMALGVPVIATRTFGLPELIDDGVTGFLCESRDVRAMAAVLERFLTTARTERERIGAAGAALVHRRHGPTDWTTAYTRLLHAVVEGPGQVPRELAPAGVD